MFCVLAWHTIASSPTCSRRIVALRYTFSQGRFRWPLLGAI